MNCSSALQWNIERKRCDTPEVAKCTVTTHFPDSFPVCRRTDVSFYPHPEKCEWYLYCNHGHMTVQQCPYYHNWDFIEQKCLERTKAKCYDGNDQRENSTGN